MRTEPQQTRKTISRWRAEWRAWTSFFTSFFLHTLFLLILAFVAIVGTSRNQPGLLIMPITDGDDSDFSLDLKSIEGIDADSSEGPSLSLAPENMPQLQSEVTADSLTNPSMLSVEGPVAQLPALNGIGVMQTAIPSGAPVFASASLKGRSNENRLGLALSGGGTRESEAAVEEALVWFAKHQYPDGGWSTSFSDPGNEASNRPACPCKGRCTNESVEELNLKRNASTGLALLCFLGAGYTHKNGKYKDEVYRGLAYLMDHIKQDEDDPTDLRWPGQFSSTGSQHMMYEQGIATLALCEAYQMTSDPLLKKSCQSAINFLIKSQHYDGSWGYQIRTPGDLSIVGWQVMALKSAASSDLDVDPTTVIRVDEFLNSQQSEKGSKYGYRSNKPRPSTTAIGLLMRLFRGWPKTDPRIARGALYLFEQKPSAFDVYFNYYTTQVLYQIQSPFWQVWNTRLRDYLVETQSKDGHEAGSWYFDDANPPPSNAIGGRLYCTAMATMTLEVYYRYMPIYDDVNLEPFKF